MRIVLRAFVMFTGALLLLGGIGLMVWNEVAAELPLITEPVLKDEVTVQFDTPAAPPQPAATCDKAPPLDTAPPPHCNETFGDEG